MSGDKLIHAAMLGDLEEMRELVARGVDINSANRAGVTALMMACQWNRVEVADFLIIEGANIETKEIESGRNALMYSCFSGNSGLVELLLQKGAKVNATDQTGRTTMMMAASIGSKDIVRLLLNWGANADFQDISGATALDWAFGTGHAEIVELLENNRPKIKGR